MSVEQASAILKLTGEFINQVGLPVAIVVAIGAAIYLIGRFLGPLIRSHSEKHLEFVDSVKEANTRQTSILETISSAIVEQAKAMGILSDAIMQPPPPKKKPGIGRRRQ